MSAKVPSNSSTRLGEMAALMRAFDWTRTPLGPVERWPASLRTTASVVVQNRFPMCLWWSRDLLMIYNDAYRLILGDKHPASLGVSGKVVWSEIWDIIGPQANAILAGEPATWNEHLLLPMNRKGYVEETYFTFSYSPVPDDSGAVGGLLITCQETTEQVQGERQLKMLRDLAAGAATEKSAEEACATAVATLAKNQEDLPFCLLYLLDVERETARLVASAGLDDYVGEAKAAVVDLASDLTMWPLAAAEREGERIVELEGTRFEGLPCSFLGAAPSAAIVVALERPGFARPAGFFVAGLSPHRAFDARYKRLIALTADQLVAAIANAKAYEEAQMRANALAEIDRAKTTFFSNVSHEFRTPLTLMLGPTEHALASPQRALAGADLETVHRNALRLLKLVNALLDFSRMEAGRAQATYVATDLAALTADLASAFRSAIERAGVRLVLDLPSPSQELFIDRDMWEKIVLNLLSNALKFTFEGEIAVRLRERERDVELVVRDTGLGIPEHELPRVFERFHRVEGSRARTHEGSGIGLALVHELVRMHGGEIHVESRVDHGTTFTIHIPKGTEHLPRERIGTPEEAPVRARGAQPFVDEALRWSTVTDEPSPAEATGPRARVLLADDNSDMREYLRRLLVERWEVDAVADGQSALEAALANPPDLVLTDVMMPRLDGFGLLHALRKDERTRATPVILLSARAGEESRIEGVEAGADDYLVKPFSARELVARVSTHLELAKLRRAAEEKISAALARERAARLAKDEFLALLGHELRNPLAPILTALEVLRLRGVQGGERERTIIERQVNHLVRLIDDLLDVARITRGRVELKKQTIEVYELVTRAVEAASPLFERKRHKLTTNVPRSGLAVDGDPIRLAQVLSNLLINAAKYTDEGGHIRVAAQREGVEAVIEVEDDGVGISPELLPTVFDMFVQARQGIERSQGGLGIGLAIVRNLVHLHGGTASAESDGPGRGSKFTVRLPVLAVVPSAGVTSKAS